MNDLQITQGLATDGTLGIISAVDLYLGMKTVVFEEIGKYQKEMSSLYQTIMQRGRNNNSEIAVSIREYTEIAFEIIDEFTKAKFNQN